MSGMRCIRLGGLLVAAALTFGGAVACGPSSGTAAQPQGPAAAASNPADASIGSTPTPSVPAPVKTSSGNSSGGSSGGSGGSSGGSSWPNPEDCITYNPDNVTVVYQSGVFSVNDGGTVIMRLNGQQGSDTGAKGLALAQRYHRHCFIGRQNSRPDRATYTFDYWRDASGRTPSIPGQDDDCSDYNRGNLTVEDMGDGNGWRVKDHDHVLQLFDNGDDARNGKLVLSKYRTICSIGDQTDDSQDQVSYLL